MTADARTDVRPLGRIATTILVLLVASLIPLLVRGGLGLYIVPPYSVVGVILAVRRPRNPIGWLLIALGVGFAVLLVPGIDATPADFQAGTVSPVEAVLAIGTSGAMGMAMFTGLFVLTAIFPSGRFPTGSLGAVARVLAGAAALLSALTLFTPSLSVVLVGSDAQVRVPNPLAVAPASPIWQVVNPDLTGRIVLLLLVGTVSLIVRYRRAAGVERRQLQWVVAAIACMVAAVLVGFVIANLIPSTSESGVAWIPAVITYPTVPAAIGVAVLRYRLFEIDRIVSRTISWALTTGLIIALFAALVVGLQDLLSSVTNENTLAVAGSTLVAFVAFQPLRRRVQSLVDHRFNRSRYDAERTVGALATGLRNGVDLDAIQVSVTGTVDRTFRPRGTGLWIRGERPESA